MVPVIIECMDSIPYALFLYLISGKMQKSNVTSFLRVALKKLIRKKVKKFAFVGLLLGAMLVCTIIWYRMQYMNYIILGIAEFMLVGVLAAGVFVLALVSEVSKSLHQRCQKT